MGGNIETERIKPRISDLYLIFSFASPKAQRDPIIREKRVVEAATIALLRIIRKNGCPLKIDI
jgi:hypothetical protein